MHCPLCDYSLQEITSETKNGKNVYIHHCGRCGGTWFDISDIHRVSYQDIVSIAALTVKPKTPSFTHIHLHCPHDHTNLTEIEMDMRPKAVSFYRCRRCHGIFATQRAIVDLAQSINSPKQDTEPVTGQSLRILFIPTITIFLLAFTTFLTISNLQQTRDSRIKASSEIYSLHVIPLSETSVHISFQTKTPVTSKITYGTSRLTFEQETISSSLSTDHETYLEGLLPNIAYIYLIELTDSTGHTYLLPERTFTPTERQTIEE